MATHLKLDMVQGLTFRPEPVEGIVVVAEYCQAWRLDLKTNGTAT